MMRSLPFQIKLEIFLPILLVILLCWALLNSGMQDDFLRTNHFFRSGDFVAFVLLGNFADNFFFLWQMARMPEFQDWARNYRFYGLSIYVILPVLFLLLWAIFGLGLGITRVMPRKSLDSDVFNWVLLFIALVNGHHSLSQSRGLSFSYAHNVSNTAPASELERSHVIERWMTRLLFVSEAVYMLFFLVILSRPSTFGENAARFLFVASVLVVGIGLLLWTSTRLGVLKSAFAVRYIPRAFLGFSPLPTYFTYALHGLESTLLTWRMIGRSRAQRLGWLKLEFLLLFVGLGLLYIYVYRPLGGALKDSEWATPVRSGFVAFAVTHYISEGFFYRFRNQHTRKFIAPLMKP